MTWSKPSMILVVIATIVLSGCGFIGVATKTTFKATDEDVSIYISRDDKDYKLIGIGEAMYRTNNYHKRYYVKQEREGGVPQVTMLGRKRVNGWKFLDFIVPVACDIALLAQVPLQRRYPMEAFVPLMVGGIGGWAVPFISPFRMYPRTVDLPEIIVPPVWSDTLYPVSMAKISADIERGKLSLYRYRGMPEFANNRSYSYEFLGEGFNVRHIDQVNSKLETKLAALGYSDTTMSLTERTGKLPKLAGELRNLKFITVAEKLKCEMTVKWTLSAAIGANELITRTVSVTTDWHQYEEDDLFKSKDKESDSDTASTSNSLTAVLQQGWELALMSILNNKGVSIALSNVRKEVEANPHMFDKTIVPSSETFVGEVTDAVDAVVTVVAKKKGHGSGCVISHDGYVVTNYHVVDQGKNTELEAILSNGDKHPLRVIHTNPSMDLALLKMDSVNIMPLRLSMSETVKVGTEVYAIGTPDNIDLGQSVTRGIISGKRQKDGKTFIQTDVSINSGNSGGALITKDGVLIGVITAKMIGVGVEGIGFAIPSHNIEEALNMEFSTPGN